MARRCGGLLNLAETAGVKVLGALPQGLPALALPWIDVGDIGAVLLGGFAVALVSFADTSVLSRTYAARDGSYVDPNQEMVAWARRIWPRACFRAFRSAAAPRAHPSPKPPARRHN